MTIARGKTYRFPFRRPSSRRAQNRRAMAIVSFLLAIHATHARAENGFKEHRNNFGMVGLIDMPSARMAPDGELAASVSFFKNTQRYNTSFQILPWLEGSFRYAGLQNYDPTAPVFFDRSFGFKARLLEESSVLPSLAIGVSDIVGTGVYNGEYIVASKRVGPVDLTLGIGWGRLGSANTFRNPLTYISDSFTNRPVTTSMAGDANFNVLFRGKDVGVFGGAVWHTPVEGLIIAAEYSSDSYVQETLRGTLTPKSQLNLGASYMWGEHVQLGLNWLYGTAIGASITLLANPLVSGSTIAPQLPASAIRTTEQQERAITRLISRIAPAPPPPHVQRSNFVDIVFRYPGLEDVQINGHEAVLQIETAADKTALCRDISRQAADSGIGITTIVLNGRGGTTVRCAVPARTAAMLAYGVSPGASKSADGRPVPSNIYAADAIRAIRERAAEQRVDVERVSVRGNEITVVYRNETYMSEMNAVNRLTKVLMAEAPSDIEFFRLIALPNGFSEREFDIVRSGVERSIAQNDESLTTLPNVVTISDPAGGITPFGFGDYRRGYPIFDWSIRPVLQKTLFDPQQPFGVTAMIAAHAEIMLRPNFFLSGSVETTLFRDVNLNRPSDSVLPHVRTDFLNYLKNGSTGISNLSTEYRFRPAPNVFARVTAGYLESMFAGVGGEILWRPEGARWALGADLFAVQQRDFDRLLGLQPYRTVTGHVSFYYASPFHDLQFTFSAGRYLAKDWGATFQITRRFATGVEVGAFFTRTNVTSAQFGEGSFDKGIIIRIPLGWVLPIPTQSEYGMVLRALQRDGGQRLSGDATLYDMTRRTSQAETLLINSSY